MQTLKGRTAVITGAASGIGRAMAHTFGAAGMRLVLADLEAGALEETRSALAADGVESVAVACDVANADAVRNLAERAEAAFGPVHVLCNNAGVFAGGTVWETSDNDYEWVFGVNVWGVIHGLQTFVPRMLAHGEPAHIVNTASMAGLTSGPLSGAYFASKHAVIALSESLYHELAMKQAEIGVSVVCPEMIATRIGEADRNRPAHLKRDDPDALPAETQMVESAIKQAAIGGADPSIIAERTLDAVRENRFYVVPPPEDGWRRAARLRNEDIDLARNPSHGGPLGLDGA